MKRFGKSFEEVLKKQLIFWEDYLKMYVQEYDCNDCCYKNDKVVSSYEIAGIGLEAMKIPYTIYYKNDTWNIYDGVTISADKDFCETVFKAIREVWKD